MKGRGDGRNYLCNQSIQVRETGGDNAEVLLADVIDRLVINLITICISVCNHTTEENAHHERTDSKDSLRTGALTFTTSFPRCAFHPASLPPHRQNILPLTLLYLLLLANPLMPLLLLTGAICATILAFCDSKVGTVPRVKKACLTMSYQVGCICSLG